MTETLLYFSLPRGRRKIYAFIFGLAVLIVEVSSWPTHAYAGCSCQCVNGQYKASCSSPTDIPPICSLRVCPFGPTLKPPPIGGASSCAQIQSCDTYGNCVWKTQCK